MRLEMEKSLLYRYSYLCRRFTWENFLVYENVTLDGVLEAPEMWQFRYLSDNVADLIKAQILDSDAILLGRVTFDIFTASCLSRAINEFGVADKLNSAPKYVVSSTLEKAERDL